jgi:hypothetical protein
VDCESSCEKWLDDVTGMILPGMLAVRIRGKSEQAVDARGVEALGSGQLATRMTKGGQLRAVISLIGGPLLVSNITLAKTKHCYHITM